MTVAIDHEHPEYKQKRLLWQRYQGLYEGGEQIKAHVDSFLVRRQKEPLDVYWERSSRVFYENYIGSIIDWYAATLFRREPNAQVNTNNERSMAFFSAFADNCDLRGSRLSDFFKRCFIETLVTGECLMLIDFPAKREGVMTQAQEDALGLSRGYLVQCSSSEVINWSKDTDDQFEWIVIRNSVEKQVSVDQPTRVKETYWRYFDKEFFRVYKRVDMPGEAGSLVQLSQGRHCLADQHRVPVMSMRVSPGLWLMNKSALLQVEHFNKVNALGWAITMGLFAMPVIYSDREWNQVVGESYYLQLGPQDRFGWTEPEGKVFDIAAQNLASLKDEIYRVCYLSQAAGDLSGGKTQSALSKMRDFAITQEVLRSYGDTVKMAIRQVLQLVAAARHDDAAVDVGGLDDFDIGDFSTELGDAQQLLSLGIQSETMKRCIYKKLALQYLADARQELKDQVSRDIDKQFAT